jgi:hypothetical protein
MIRLIKKPFTIFRLLFRFVSAFLWGKVYIKEIVCHTSFKGTVQYTKNTKKNDWLGEQISCHTLFRTIYVFCWKRLYIRCSTPWKVLKELSKLFKTWKKCVENQTRWRALFWYLFKILLENWQFRRDITTFKVLKFRYILGLPISKFFCNIQFRFIIDVYLNNEFARQCSQRCLRCPGDRGSNSIFFLCTVTVKIFPVKEA